MSATLAVETTPLFYQTGGGRTLCNGLYLAAGPGTITAIMGPAGCGKSVLLKLLVGYERPTRGCVFIFGDRLDEQFETVQERIGYVPQAEIMIPELTVEHSLDYRLRLRTPAMERAERERIIRETCVNVGLVNPDELLLKRIGSPESRGAYPSGGERRRINIAHEMLSRPRVLFLDEPTSGLSSVDADNLVYQLRELANAGLTVVVTIHQPSRAVFERMDDLLLVNWGGTVAYYGGAQHAVGYFEQISGLPLGARQSPSEYLLEFVRDREIGAWTVQQFEQNQRSGRFASAKPPAARPAE